METFVDRESALEYIDGALATLVDKKRLLRTPIIDVYGIGGTGKTFLLKKVQQRCQSKHLSCIWVNASQNVSSILREIVRQVLEFGIVSPFEDSDTNLLYESVSAIRILLERGHVVILFDDIDTSNRTQQNWLEILLRELSDASTLFVVLTTKRKLLFENDRSLARKITFFALQPFDRSACETYLSKLSTQIDPKIYENIFAWTRGFPLALNVMAQAVLSGLDPRNEQDQKEIITHLTEQVLDKSILIKVEPIERAWYHIMLALLSVPRHFNLIMLQDLVERFAPGLALENSLAYFGLPREIIQATEVLNWNPTGTGYSVDMPARTIFLLKLRVEQPERYYDIHRFLAQMNKRWAGDVRGSDRVRYLCEYLYHGANENATMLEQFLNTALREIEETYPESFAQFTEEIMQDENFKEILNGHPFSIESLMHKSADYKPEG